MKVDVRGAQQVKAALKDVTKKMFGGNMYALIGYGQSIGNGGMVARAYYNQEGTRTIEERPFLDKGVELVADQWIKAGEKSIAKLAEKNGKGGMDGTLDIMAQLAVGGVQIYIQALKQPENKESTERQKGKNDPLVEHGEMKRETKYELTSEQPEEM